MRVRVCALREESAAGSEVKHLCLVCGRHFSWCLQRIQPHILSQPLHHLQWTVLSGRTNGVRTNCKPNAVSLHFPGPNPQSFPDQLNPLPSTSPDPALCTQVWQECSGQCADCWLLWRVWQWWISRNWKVVLADGVRQVWRMMPIKWWLLVLPAVSPCLYNMSKGSSPSEHTTGGWPESNRVIVN